MNLTELQKADPETWEEIQIAFVQLDRYQEDDNYCVDVMETIKCYGELQFPITYYIIQGCLQRAIEKRGWYYSVGIDGNDSDENGKKPGASIWTGEHILAGWTGNSPVEALLSAYLEALHETS